LVVVFYNTKMALADFEKAALVPANLLSTTTASHHVLEGRPSMNIAEFN